MKPRILFVGVGCELADNPSDKQFINDVISALPDDVVVAVWTINDMPPGEYGIAGRSPANRFYAENRLGHSPIASHPLENVSHPPHSALRHFVEIGTTVLRSSFGSFRRVVKEFKPDIIHLCDNTIGPMSVVFRMLHRRVPFVATKRTVAMSHGVKGLAYKAYVRSSLSSADCVLTHTKAAVHELIRLGVPAERIRISPWGVKPPVACSKTRQMEIRSRYGATDRELLVVVAPRGSRDRVVEVIRQVSRLKRQEPFRFVVAIRPTLFETYMRWLQGAGIDIDSLPNVRFENGPSDFYDLLWAADAMFCADSTNLMTSLIPLTWLEAMVRRTPVIAFDTPGAGECLKHGVTGFVVRPGSDLLPYLNELLRKDRRRRMAENARETVLTEYLVSSITDQYLELWQRLAVDP